MTQEPVTDANLGDQSFELAQADSSHDTRNQQSGPGEISSELRESMRSIVREEIQKQLTDLDYARILAERAAHDEEYVELKLREAFLTMPGIKSVSYTRKCDEWTLVMLHNDEDKAGAHRRLIRKLCDISRDDPRMPVFETWILHVSNAGGSVPVGEKSIVER